jgi:protocatechuate 3,4-dioxygenase beta subunit
MKQLFVIQHPIILMVLFLTCNEPQDTGNDQKEKNCSKLETGQKGFIQLTRKDEPGEPLVIYGKIIDRKTNHPVKDVSLFLYQTDTSGVYNTTGAPDDQASIRGTVHTNESGCFRIKTILPGDYPGQNNSRHIHYVINAKGYKEMKSILFFKGFTTANITGQGPLSVLDIKKDKDGTWIGSIDIHIDGTN